MDVGMTETAKKRLLRNIWAGHEERMGNKKLAKRTDAQKVEGQSLLIMPFSLYE